MNVFFPEDYEIPKVGGSYMKLEDGENHFRILTVPVVGYEYWTADNKPVRSRELPKETPNIKQTKDGEDTKVKHFWAMTVWNYKTKNIEVLQVAQSTVQKAILALSRDKDWGSPLEYDLKVTRSGSGFDTEYAVTPRPKTPLAEEIALAFGEAKINLEALLDGNNPFE